MSEPVSITAVVLEEEYFGDTLTPTSAEKIIRNESAPLGPVIWAHIIQLLKFQLAISSKKSGLDVFNAVKSGQASVGLSLVKMLDKRHVDLIFEPVEEKRFCLMVAHEPLPLSADLRGMFNSVVWLTIGLAGISMILILALEKRTAGANVDWAEIAVAVTGIMCFQGSLAIAPSEGRLVLMTGLVLGYLLLVSFSTQLVAQLTFGRSSAPPKAGTVLDSFRIFTLEPEILALAKSAKGPLARVEKAENASVVCRAGVALLVEQGAPLAPTLCSTTVLPRKVLSSQWGFLMRRQPVMLRARKILRRLVEGGLVDKLMQRKKVAVKTAENAAPRAAGFAFIVPMIAILTSGCALSVLVLVLELLFPGKVLKKKLKNRPKTKNRPKIPYLIIVKEAPVMR